MPEQEKSEGAEISGDFDSLSTKELAYHMTLFDWELFWNVHEVRGNVINQQLRCLTGFCFLVRIDIPHVRQTSVPTNHSEFRHIPQTIQRNPILGYHRDMHVPKYIEKNQYTKKND